MADDSYISTLFVAFIMGGIHMAPVWSSTCVRCRTHIKMYAYERVGLVGVDMTLDAQNISC